MAGEAERRIGTLAVGGVAALLLYKYVTERLLKGTVSVKAVDFATGDPIPGASVEVDGVAGTTGNDGRVSLSVGTGWRTVRASKLPDYDELRKQVKVAPFQTVEVTMELAPPLPPPSPSGYEDVSISALADQLFGREAWSEKYTLGTVDLPGYCPWWVYGYLRLLGFYRPWAEKGELFPPYSSGSKLAEPYWPVVPATLRKWLKVKLPVENLRVRLYNPAWDKEYATLSDGTCRFLRVPDGEYYLVVSYGDSTDLEYVLNGERGRSQKVTVDKDHKEFRVYIPDQEGVFPKRQAGAEYNKGVGEYFIMPVEQPVPGGVDWFLITHTDPSYITPDGGDIFLEVWEADDPNITSIDDPKVKEAGLAYTTHRIKVEKKDDKWVPSCSCGWRGGEHGEAWTAAYWGGILDHFVRGLGMPSGQALMIPPIEVEIAYEKDGTLTLYKPPPHVYGMVVVSGAHKFLYVKFWKSSPLGPVWSLLRIDLGVATVVGGQAALVLPPLGYHPRTEHTSAGVELWLACPVCGFATSKKTLPWPLDFKQVMVAKKEAWEEFMSDAHLSKHPAGTEFEGPETRLRQVLLWGWGAPPEPTYGLLPEVSVSSALGSMASSLGVAPEVSVSSTLGGTTSSLGLSPSVSVSSSLSPTTSSLGLSPSATVSSALSPTASSFVVSPSATVSSSLSKTTA